jgi:lysozyme
MKTSQKGVDLIKGFESFSPVPYKCEAGKLTIGYGHLIKPKENFTRITKEEAEDILKKDISATECALNQYVSVNLNQNQFDALVSLVFNIGVGNFFTSTLLHILNKEDYAGASEQFDRWIFVKKRISHGLERRRKKEKELFES